MKALPLLYYLGAYFRSGKIVLPRPDQTPTEKRKHLLADQDGKAKEGQLSMADTWEAGIVKWQTVNFPKALKGIEQLPVSQATQEQISQAFRAQVQKEAFDKQDKFKPLTKAFAWNLLFTVVNSAYRQAIGKVSLRERFNIWRANPLSDPFFHVKSAENEAALKSLSKTLGEPWQTLNYNRPPSIYHGIRPAAVGNAIDQFRGAVSLDSPLLYDLVDHRQEIVELLIDLLPIRPKIAFCPDNAGEIMSDLALIHILLAVGFDVTIFSKDRPYMVKDVNAAEVPYLASYYDQVFTEICPEEATLLHYIYMGRLKISTHPFTTSGLGFSSQLGLQFAEGLKEQGFGVVFIKGEAWVEQLTDVRNLDLDTQLKNPWPIPIVSLHVAKNADLVFGIEPETLDMIKKPVVMRLLP